MYVHNSIIGGLCLSLSFLLLQLRSVPGDQECLIGDFPQTISQGVRWKDMRGLDGTILCMVLRNSKPKSIANDKSPKTQEPLYALEHGLFEAGLRLCSLGIKDASPDAGDAREILILILDLFPH